MPFEKGDTHPTRKATMGKWRIVVSLSLIDQLVERALISPVLNLIKDAYPSSNAVIGIGFSDEQATEFGTKCDEMPRPLYSSDVEGFEKVHGRTYIRHNAEMVIAKIRNGGKYTKLAKALLFHANMITNPVYLIPSLDGTFWRLIVRGEVGGMLSGSFFTTLYNTMTRQEAAALAKALDSQSSGDDCIESHDCTPGELIEKYAKLGFKLRDVVEIPHGRVEFCSHIFSKGNSGWTARLTNWSKALYNVLTKSVDQDQLFQFYYETRHNLNRTTLHETVDQFANLRGDALDPVYLH